jgi:hypothetical protein
MVLWVVTEVAADVLEGAASILNIGKHVSDCAVP